MGLINMTEQEMKAAIMQIALNSNNVRKFTYPECEALIKYFVERCSANLGREIAVEFADVDPEGKITIQQAKEMLAQRETITTPIPESVAELIFLLHKQGVSKSSIATKLGISRRTVYKYLKENSICGRQ